MLTPLVSTPAPSVQALGAGLTVHRDRTSGPRQILLPLFLLFRHFVDRDREHSVLCDRGAHDNSARMTISRIARVFLWRPIIVHLAVLSINQVRGEYRPSRNADSPNSVAIGRLRFQPPTLRATVHTKGRTPNMMCAVRNGVILCLALQAAAVGRAQTPPSPSVGEAAAIMAAARAALGGDERVAAVNTIVTSVRSRQVRGDNLVHRIRNSHPVPRTNTSVPTRFQRRRAGPRNRGFNGES